MAGTLEKTLALMLGDGQADPQGKLASLVEEYEVGAGLVRVKVNGKLEFLEIEVDDLVRSEPPFVMRDLLIAAVNGGIRKAFDRVLTVSVTNRAVASGTSWGPESPVPTCRYCTHLGVYWCGLCSCSACHCCVERHRLSCAGELRDSGGNRVVVGEVKNG